MNPYCAICKNHDLATLISLAWNGKMSLTAISSVLGGKPTADAIGKHLKADVPGAWTREIEVEHRPLRQRVYDIQRLQIDEIERRIEMAKDMARQRNELVHEGPDHDWSEFFDILDKDMQAAIGSILKAQANSDKNENAQRNQAISLFQLMLGKTAAGVGPGALAPPELTAGDDGSFDIEGEARDVTDAEA